MASCWTSWGARWRSRSAIRWRPRTSSSSPARISCGFGRFPPIIPRICASGRTSSSPPWTPTASCATRCAISWAASRTTSRPSRSRMRICPSLNAGCCTAIAEIDEQVRRDYNDFDFKRAYRTIAGILLERPVRDLLRYPQGYALLRGLFEPQAPRFADGPEYAVRVPDGVDRSAPLLYGGGGLACALWRGEERLGSLGRLSRKSRQLGGTRRWARNGRRSGPSAAW